MRNIILVTIDSLRADHCGFMGYKRNTTPELDQLAEQSLVFENAFAPGPSTYESMPAVFTGRQMSRYPVGVDESELDTRMELIRLNTRSETIPEWFARNGYETGAFTTNPYTSADTNFARGFDHYEDFLNNGEGLLMSKAADLPVLSELKHLVTLVRGDRASKPWQSYFDRITEWMSRVSEPYFLWVFLLEPHTPYLVPDKHRERHAVEMYYRNWKLWAAKKWGLDLDLTREALVGLYDGAVRSADSFVGRLRSEARDDPVIAVHADHGEAFGEHGTYGHRQQVYEENIHVPLILWNVSTTGRIQTPVSLTSLPALLSQAAMDDLNPPEMPYVIATTLGPRRVAVRGENWKYIATVDTEAQRIEEEELYDLKENPDEIDNHADDEDRVDLGRRIVRRRLSHESETVAVYSAAAEIV